MSNFRRLGREKQHEYDISWYLEDDAKHPNQICILKISISNGIRTFDRRYYPITVLQSLSKQLEHFLRWQDDSHICPECGDERGLTNDCPTCNS